jgi:hypothetical protein
VALGLHAVQRAGDVALRSITKVERLMPMRFFPYMFLSTQTP